MAPDSASSAPSSKTPTHGCSTTSASIEDTTAPPVLFNLCLPQPASLSSQTGSQIYENRLLCENSSRQCIYRCPGFCPTYLYSEVLHAFSDLLHAFSEVWHGFIGLFARGI